MKHYLDCIQNLVESQSLRTYVDLPFEPENLVYIHRNEQAWLQAFCHLVAGKRAEWVEDSPFFGPYSAIRLIPPES